MAGSAFVASVLTERDRSAAVHLVQRQARRVLSADKRVEIIRACENHAGTIVRLEPSESPIAVAIVHRDEDQADIVPPFGNDIVLTDLAVEQRYSRCGVGRFAFETAICMSVVTCDGPIGRIAVGSVAKGEECASFLQHVGVSLLEPSAIRVGSDPWLTALNERLLREKQRDLLTAFDHRIGIVDRASIPAMAERVIAAANDALVQRHNGHRFRFADPSEGRAALIDRLISMARRDVPALARLGISWKKAPRLVVNRAAEAVKAFPIPGNKD